MAAKPARRPRALEPARRPRALEPARRPRALEPARPKKEGLRVLCISGPNLQLLGSREPAIYGKETLADIHERLHARARELRCSIDTRQTNHEGEIVTFIGDAPKNFDAIILNPAAYTHTSIAIYDALKSVGLPCVEVHLSNPDAREEFRRHSWVAPACLGRIAGFGGSSYLLALEGLVAKLGQG